MKAKRTLVTFTLALGLTLGLLWLLSAGPLPHVLAATYTVTTTNASGPGSLRQAILDANGNPGYDTIDFAPGVNGTVVLTDALPAISGDLTISGPGAESLAVSGANAYRVFSVTNGVAVTVTGITVRDGYITGDGGGIWSAGTLVLSTVRVISNTAAGSSPNGRGGGVYVSQGSATLAGTQVLSNLAQRGGGVYVGSGGVSLIGAQVFSNTATGTYPNGRGGGVYVYEGGIGVSGGEVRGNSASSSGGGVYIAWGGSATLVGTQVLNNSVSYYGGGVYADWGDVTLSEVEVRGNSARDGGGVFVDSGNATLAGTQVFSNSASSGGGIYVRGGWWGGSAALTGTQVLSNSASEGGGVYIAGGSTALTGTQVFNNSAYSGGGVYVCDASVSGGEVRGNSAQDGGGVYVTCSGSTTLAGTQVFSNSASGDGGGVYITSWSHTSVGEVEVRGNSALTGSAVYNIYGIITPTTPLTVTGDVYQAGIAFYGSDHALRVEGALVLAGGDFYAPGAFTLTGPFTHTGGTYHQTRDVSSNGDVGFPKAGGVILNANGQDLGSTEVALTAGAGCAGVPVGKAVEHCYIITPTNATGRDTTVTFYYRGSEALAGQACAAIEAYRWDGTWDNPLMRDGSYGAGGRMCGADPQSIRVMHVTTFSPFVLAGSYRIYLPMVVCNYGS